MTFLCPGYPDRGLSPGPGLVAGHAARARRCGRRGLGRQRSAPPRRGVQADPGHGPASRRRRRPAAGQRTAAPETLITVTRGHGGPAASCQPAR